MGLDITAFAKVTLHRALTVEQSNDEGGEHEPYELLYDGEWRGDGLIDGLYETSGESYNFRAGSYGGYNTWRDQLARLVGRTAKQVHDEKGAVAGPFVELIWFSDCEGFIGPQTSAKLARDFAEWQGRADALAALDAGWFLSRYNDWRKAFELAAGAGAVSFH